MTYQDLLHIYAVSRANYIPQLFSLRLPNPDVVYELLRKAQTVYLIYDGSFEAIVGDCPVPRHTARAISEDEVEGETLAPLSEIVLSPDDIVSIFHTSGSTSGSPKLVPASLRWINSVVEKSEKVTKPRNPARQDVTVWL